MSDSNLSGNFDRYLQRGKVTRARKTQITLSVTFAITLATEQIPERRGSCAGQSGQDGSGMTPSWAGATTLWDTVRAQSESSELFFGGSFRRLVGQHGQPVGNGSVSYADDQVQASIREI